MRKSRNAFLSGISAFAVLVAVATPAGAFSHAAPATNPYTPTTFPTPTTSPITQVTLPGTPPAIANPLFAFTPETKNALQAIFGALPFVVANADPISIPATIDTGAAAGSPSNPIFILPGQSITSSPGGSVTLALALGAAFANKTFNMSVTMPGGATVQISVTANANGVIGFTVGVIDPKVSINGSAPIPVQWGANTIVVATQSGTGYKLVKVTFNVNHAPVAATSTKSMAWVWILVAVALVLVLGALMLISRRKKAEPDAGTPAA